MTRSGHGARGTQVSQAITAACKLLRSRGLVVESQANGRFCVELTTDGRRERRSVFWPDLLALSDAVGRTPASEVA